MMLAGILRALRDLPGEASEEIAARMGFLEWVMTLPPGCSEAAAARAAERRAAPLAQGAPAVALFCGHLRAVQLACEAPARPARRGGAAGRRDRS